MTTENILVELVTPTASRYAAYTGVSPKRFVQVTTGAGTCSVDGTTYTRTSPLRTQQSHGGQAPELDLVADGNAWQAPVGSRTDQGNTPLAIFSQSGT